MANFFDKFDEEKDENFFDQYDPSFGDKALGVAENIASMGSAMIADPIAGLGGMATGLGVGAANLLGLTDEEGTDAATDFIKQAKETMTYTPESQVGKQYQQNIGEFMQPVGEAMSAVESGLGEAVLEATGSPALAAVAHTLPTAALEALGIKGLTKAKTASLTPEEIQKQKSFVTQGFEPKQFDKNKIFSDADKKTAIDEMIAGGNKEQLAAMIEADPDFFKALDVLEAKEKGIPSSASKNRQYQETEQALKKISGSNLANKEFDQISELQKISDDLIVEFGGRTDKASLSMSLANDADRVINNLSEVTTQAYNSIAENIPKQSMSKMENIGEMIRQEADDLGGDLSQLSTLEKRLLNMSENGATYHALDKIRKEVGNTLSKKSDKYKSEDVGALKRIYAKLTQDQEVVAIQNGMGESWQGAKDLVIQRKALEDNSIKMFGKDLSDAFMPKMGLAMRKLTTGDYKNFSEMMDAVPEGRKQEVVVSALNDVFTMGSRKEKQLSVAGYADWFNGISKNPKLKAELYSHMPKELTNKLDAMGKVTDMIRKAQDAAPIGGQIMANTGVMSKVVDGIAKRFLIKMPGMIGDLVQVGLDKSKSKSFDKAMEVLNDPDFIANINSIAKGQARKAEKFEQKLMKKKKYRDFINSLPSKEAKAISVLGLTSWLSRYEEQDEDQ